MCPGDAAADRPTVGCAGTNLVSLAPFGAFGIAPTEREWIVTFVIIVAPTVMMQNYRLLSYMRCARAIAACF